MADLTALPSPMQQLAAALTPDPDSTLGRLAGAVGDWYGRGGIAGSLGMVPVSQQIHEATQAQLNAPDLRSALAAAVQNPMTMAVGPATIRAYHGSPFSFDKFDLSKVGTGEGAQAYGHGLYFAENEGVAKAYRDDLGGVGYFVNGEHVGTNGALGKNWRGLAASHLADTEGDANAALAKVAASAERRKAGGYGYYPDEADAVAREIEKMRGLPVEWRPMGSMYEVNLHADPAALLDWDKPLAQQSPQVRQAIDPDAMGLKFRQADPPSGYPYMAFVNEQNRPIGMMQRGGTPDTFRDSWVNSLTRPEATGSELYSRLGLTKPESTAALNSAGIPGIRYLDGGSRGAGTGTSNYVMFDPARVEILRKYGLLAGALTGAGAADAGDPGSAQ